MRQALRVIGIAVVVVVILAIIQIVRPVPNPTIALATGRSPAIAGSLPRIAWPSAGEAALAVEGVGSLGTSGGNAPIPIGSVAKLMTAYIVLLQHPLSLNQNGPSVTITQKEAQEFQTELSQQQSVVAVSAGERLTELQLLQGMLIPSGNNLAQVLARWVSGNQSAFVAQMNVEARKLGLRNTHYADASGLSPLTVSSASDQLRLAELLMKNPVFAAIVASPQVDLPVAGLVYNYNGQVGHGGIIGIKTGSTLQAGGCFVFARAGTVNGQPVTIVGAVLGQGLTSPSGPLQVALNEGVALASEALAVVHPVRLVHAGQTIAWVRAPWAPEVSVPAASTVEFLGWPGLHASLTVTEKALGTRVASGQKVGRATWRMGDQSVTMTLRTAGSIAPPGLRYKVSRL